MGVVQLQLLAFCQVSCWQPLSEARPSFDDIESFNHSDLTLLVERLSFVPLLLFGIISMRGQLKSLQARKKDFCHLCPQMLLFVRLA